MGTLRFAHPTSTDYVGGGVHTALGTVSSYCRKSVESFMVLLFMVKVKIYCSVWTASTAWLK